MTDSDVIIDAEVDVETPGPVMNDSNNDDEQLMVEDLFKDEDGNTAKDDEDYDEDDEDVEIEILEYIDIVDEGYFTPTDIMLLFISCLVLIVAAGVGVSIYFAYENQPDNDPTFAPTRAPIVVAPTLPPGYVCRICADGVSSNITNPDAIVDIAGRPTCADLVDRGLSGEFTEAQCNGFRAQVEGTCGCATGNASASGCTTVCANGEAVRFPDGILDVSAAGFPGIDTLSCGQLDSFAGQGLIPDEYCLLLQNVSGTICGCEGATTDDNSEQACAVCAEGVIQNMEGILDVSTAGIPGIDTLSCGQLDSFASQGLIPAEFCSRLQNASATICDCGNIADNSTEKSCTVCAEGVIRNPDGVLNVSSAGLPGGIETISCGALNTFAEAGQIPTEFCSSLQQASLDTCDCATEEAKIFVCPICNSSIEGVQNPDSEVQLGNQTFSCAELVSVAETGGIEQSVCPSLQADVSESCGCAVSEEALFRLLENVAGGGVNVEGRPENLAARYLLDEDPRFNNTRRRQLLPIDLPCTVCAIGEMLNPEGILDGSFLGVPGITNITCGEVDDFAAAGQIPVDLCPLLQEASVEACDCRELVLEMEIPTICAVCAEGEVRNPEGILDVSAAGFVGVSTISCGDLNNMATEGKIPLDFCPLLQGASVEPCDCGLVAMDGMGGSLPVNQTETSEQGEGGMMTPISLRDLTTEQIVQRYLLILFYFQTSGSRLQPWITDCAPQVPERRKLQGSGAGTFVDKSETQPWLGAAQECMWAGVTCDEKMEQVTALRLSGVGLTGRFPASILGLQSLSVIDFSVNGLMGPFAGDVSVLTHLKTLNVYDNLLSGSIPTELSSIVNLTTVNFGKNNLTGEVSPEICNISSLVSLAVDCEEVKCDCCICCTEGGCSEAAVVV